MDFMELWDKFWKDKHGHVVVWQMPNAYLIAWAILSIVALATAGHSGHLSDIFAGTAAIVLIVWSGLEILKGVNYFRRLLGLIVLLYSVATLLKIF